MWVHAHTRGSTHTAVGALTLTLTYTHMVALILTHLWVHAHSHTWARSHSHPCGCAHTHTHTWVCSHSHSHGFTYTHTPVGSLIHPWMHSYSHTCWVRSHSQRTRELNIRGNTLEFALLICSFRRLLTSLHSYHWLFIPEHPSARRGNWCLLSQSTRPPFWELLRSPFPHLHGFSIPEVSVIRSTHMASLAVFFFFT